MNNKPDFDKETNEKIEQLMEVILETRFTDLDRDYETCAELLKISEDKDYKYGIAYAYAYMGDCLIGKNESVNASASLMRAKELCEYHRYLDLLPYVCTWLGIYYEMQNDRQMAMHCYLDALEFAEANHDLFRQSILYNNIASQFQSCGSFEVAKKYYIKAFNSYNELNISSAADPHFAQLTANIISVCSRLKQIEEAKYYFDVLEKSNQAWENRNQLYLCELLIAAAVGDIDEIHESVDKYLIQMQEKPQDVHQFFETLLVIASSMISLEEPEYAHTMLTILGDLCREHEFGHKLKVQYVWMSYYKNYGTQAEKNAAYKEFYELRERNDEVLNRNLADGLLTSIKLKESVKKTQEMAKKQEKLEGEVQVDELTRLFNRRTFREMTQQASADPETQTLSFVMIDVDYFKQYNDTYGHPKGDKALRAVAEILSDASEEDIYNFRYGGDEFVSICKNKTVEEVEQYIRNLTEILWNKHIPHQSSLCSNQITLSIGYSYGTRQNGKNINVTRLMSEADKALYESKDKGRNCHSRYLGKS